MKLIRVYTCYGENFVCTLFYKNRLGLHTDRGLILYDEINYFDYIGYVRRK